MNENKPRLIKIPWELVPRDKDDPQSWHKLDKGIWFRQPNSSVRTIHVQNWGINGLRLRHSADEDSACNCLVKIVPAHDHLISLIKKFIL